MDDTVDLDYTYDASLRPVPNNPAAMRAAAVKHVEAAATMSGADRAHHLGRAGMYLAMLGDLERAETLLGDALEICVAAGAERARTAMRLRLGQVVQWSGRAGRADEIFAEEIARCRHNDELDGYLDYALQHAGKSALQQGRAHIAIEYFREAMAIRLARGDAELIASTQLALDAAEAAMHDRPENDMRQSFEESEQRGEAEARAAVLRLEDAVRMLPAEGGAPFVELFTHGSLSMELFAPRGRDTQQPHSRDELYVVVSGSGEFSYGAKRRSVSAGDFIFVPAGLDHRFENFSDDLTLWVVFYGPEGGERQ